MKASTSRWCVALALLSCGTACGSDGGSDGNPGTSSGGSSGVSGAGGASGFGGSSGNGGSSGSGGASAGSGGSSAGSGGGSSGSGGTSGSGGAGTAGTGGGDVDPPPGEYGQRAQLLEANSEMAVAEVNGKIYIVGGYPSSRVVMSTVQVYDVATDTWALSEPLPVGIHHPVVKGVGGKLYSFGGQMDSADTDRTLVFDPATGGPWVDLAPMPTARGAGAAAVLGDQVYVVGGRPPAGNAFEVYDIGDDAWTPLPDLPQAFPDRNHLAAAAIGGKIYVAGGRHSGGSFSDPMTDSLDVFDPAVGEWQAAAPMLRPRGGVNGIEAFGCFFVWGGEGANIGEPNNVFPDHDVYNPLTNVWMELPDLPTPVHGVTGAAFVDGLIFMPGGGTMQGGSSGSTIFQVYRPDISCE